MFVWQNESEIPIAVWRLNFCIQNIVNDFSILLTSDEDASNCFLYTDSTFSGVVSAKLLGGASYLPIGAYSLTPTCFLGDLTADTIYTVLFQADFSTDYIGEQVIPIYVGYGDGIIGPDDIEFQSSFGEIFSFGVIS